MILLVIIGLLALFSLISYLLGTDEPRQSSAEHWHDATYFLRFGRG